MRSLIVRVENTVELQRITKLPRRKLDKRRAAKLAEEMGPKLRLRRSERLREWQAWCLHEAGRPGGCGLFGGLPVGQGKTLLFELIPVWLRMQGLIGPRDASVLIMNASLREKTYADRRALAGKWRAASPPARVISREELADERNAYLLRTLKPRVIMIDEADEFSNFDASATQRIHRYVVSERKAGRKVWVIAATGTPTRRSIMGVWHILLWCLGDEGVPLPRSRDEAKMWAAALDDAAPRQGFRADPGPLGSTLEKARAWYLDRLEQTQGVVLVDEDSAEGVPLYIGVKLAPKCRKIDSAFDTLYEEWRSPSGEEVSDPLSLMRIDMFTGSGLVTYYDPPPPQEWREARQKVAAFIRQRVSATRHAAKPLDTDAQVMRAHPKNPHVVRWREIRGTYNPLRHAKARWLSTRTIDWAAEWLLDGDKPTILWCGSVEFARRLAKETGVPYYGPEGREVRSGRELHAARADRRDARMIVSWHANKRGFNLQAWRRNGIIQMPQSAKFLEQIFGRPHRAGQTEPVEFTILATSGGTLDALAAAVGEAEFARDTMRITQKLLRAKFRKMPTPPSGVRWVTKG